MELRDLIFLGACALLAPEVQQSGFDLSERRIANALVLSKAVWKAAVEDKDI